MTTTNLTVASHQWATRPSDQRFETLEALQANVNARRMRSRSADIDLGRVHAEEQNGRLVINSQIAPSEPSHWGFGQFASSIKAPASYLRTLPLPLVLPLLNHGLQNSERETAKFMTIAPENGGLSTLQAVTSTKYGRIWDADVVAAVMRIVERSGGKFFNPKAYSINGGPPRPSGLYASDHDVFMFLIDGGSLLDAGDRAQLHRGFITWNSETRARTFGLMTFLFNAICGNHIIWGAQDVNKLVIRHTQGGPARFDSEAMPTLKAYAEASAEPLLATVKRAQNYLLSADANKPTVESAMEFCEIHSRAAKFSRSEISSAVDFAKSEEGDCRTLWQLVQGFTAYARGFDYIDSRVDLEKRAGSLLNIAGK